MAIGVNDVRQFMSEIWDLILNDAVKPRPTPPTMDDAETYIGCVQITGAWRGTVSMEMPIDLARKLTARMMSLENPYDATPDLFQDALGELVNMFAGNVRAVLPPPTYLSLPVVGPSRGFAIEGLQHHKLIELGFESFEIPFVIGISKVELDTKHQPLKLTAPVTPPRIPHPIARTNGSSIMEPGKLILSNDVR
jgi:chemotaxis protein CheX